MVIMIHGETTEFSWNTEEYQHRPKSTDWYWALGILVIVGSAIAFLNNNLLFGFLILLGGTLIGIFAGKKPDPLSVEISVEGVAINNNIIGYRDISAFWLYRNPFGTRKLILKTNKNFTPIISIPLADEIKATELRVFLLKMVPEQELQESFTDLLLERIGF